MIKRIQKDVLLFLIISIFCSFNILFLKSIDSMNNIPIINSEYSREDSMTLTDLIYASTTGAKAGIHYKASTAEDDMKKIIKKRDRVGAIKSLDIDGSKSWHEIVSNHSQNTYNAMLKVKYEDIPKDISGTCTLIAMMSISSAVSVKTENKTSCYYINKKSWEMLKDMYDISTIFNKNNYSPSRGEVGTSSGTTCNIWNSFYYVNGIYDTNATSMKISNPNSYSNAINIQKLSIITIEDFYKEDGKIQGCHDVVFEGLRVYNTKYEQKEHWWNIRYSVVNKVFNMYIINDGWHEDSTTEIGNGNQILVFPDNVSIVDYYIPNMMNNFYASVV